MKFQIEVKSLDSPQIILMVDFKKLINQKQFEYYNKKGNSDNENVKSIYYRT